VLAGSDVNPQVKVISSGHDVSTGSVVSTTVMVWIHSAVLAELSSAVHVRVSVYELAQSPSVLTSSKLIVRPAQLSVAVIVAGSGMASHSTVTSAGQASTNTGASSSIANVIS